MHPPVPFDTLLADPFLYNEMQPPFVPGNIAIAPEGAQILVQACSAAANAVTERATKSQPMAFFFNFLIQNNYQNQDFIDFVSLVVNVQVYKFRNRQIPNIHHGLYETAVQIALILASIRVLDYPVAFNSIAGQQPGSANGIHNNANQFNTIRQQADSVLNQHVSVGMVGGHSTGHQGSIGRAGVQVRTSGVHPAAASHATNQPQTQQRIGPRRQREQQQAETVQAPVAEVKKQNYIEEGNEMDKSVHALIYGGKGYGNRLKERDRQLQQVSEEIQKTAIDVANPDLLQSNSIIPETTLENALDTIMSRNSKDSDPDQLTVVTSTVNLLRPVLAATSIGHIVNKIKDVVTFTALANRLGEALVGTVNQASGFEKMATIAWLKRVDVELTTQINYYLRYALPDKTTITSFIQDAPDLAQYLNKKYDGRLNENFQSYQRSFMETLFANTHSGDVKFPELESNNGDNPDAPADYDILNFNYAVYYINNLWSALNYEVEADKVHVVSQAKAPQLHRFLSVLSESTRKAKVIRHVIHTLDGQTLFFYAVAGSAEFRLTQG